MLTPNKLGTALYYARLEANITQEKAAELVDVCVETIRNIEYSKTKPNLKTVLKLWIVYELPKETLWDYQI